MSEECSAAEWARAVLAGEESVYPSTLNLRVLDQDQIWVDETGHVHLLAEMDLLYLTNVLIFLRTHSRTFQRRVAIARVCDLLDAVDETLDPIDIGHIAVQALGVLEHEDPDTWLATTPLAAAITSHLAHRRPGSFT